MNRAVYIETNQIINAVELPYLNDINKMRFCCIDDNCATPVIPSAFKKGNKQIPHFRKLKGHEHDKKCKYALYNTVLSNAANGNRISNQDLIKVGYPTRFNIKLEKDEDIKISSIQKEGKNIQSKSSAKQKGSGFEFSNFKGKQVSAIDRIVDFYLNFPANRDVKIKIDGIECTYDELFKEIVAGKKFKGKDNQFFYSKVMLNKEKLINKSLIEGYKRIIIKLFAADFFEDGHRKNYELIFNKDDLSKKKLSKILNSFNVAYDKFKFESDKSKGLYVFFIGNAPQSKDDISFNLVNGYICFRYTNIRINDDEANM